MDRPERHLTALSTTARCSGTSLREAEDVTDERAAPERGSSLDTAQSDSDTIDIALWLTGHAESRTSTWRPHSQKACRTGSAIDHTDHRAGVRKTQEDVDTTAPSRRTASATRNLSPMSLRRHAPLQKSVLTRHRTTVRQIYKMLSPHCFGCEGRQGASRARLPRELRSLRGASPRTALRPKA